MEKRVFQQCRSNLSVIKFLEAYYISINFTLHIEISSHIIYFTKLKKLLYVTSDQPKFLLMNQIFLIYVHDAIELHN